MRAGMACEQREAPSVISALQRLEFVNVLLKLRSSAAMLERALRSDTP